MPKEVKVSVMLSIVSAVLTGAVTAISVAVWMTSEFTALRTTQNALIVQVSELKSNDKERADQVAALATMLTQATTSVQTAMASQLNFNSDMRAMWDQSRKDREWARNEIVRLQERIR